MKKDYPYFNFWYKEFEADENVKVMNLQQVGAYIWLMISCWHEGSLPSDQRKLAILAKYHGKDFKKDIWKDVGVCFRLREGRYHHPRIDKEREKIESKHKILSEAGRRGGLSQAQGRLEPPSSIPEPYPYPKPDNKAPSVVTNTKDGRLFSEKDEKKIKAEIAKTLNHSIDSEANQQNFNHLVQEVLKGKNIKNAAAYGMRVARNMAK